MKNVAIVSEYDPFHNGHKYQADKLREMGAECIVSVLGGCFSQRGNTHITDKYYRAEAALLGGCDLVLELPYPYSCSSAEYFASAGVYIASRFCDHIAFGCETDEPELLTDIARFTCSQEYFRELDEMRKSFPEGSSPVIYERLIREHLSDKHAEEASLPNNILCIEYLRAVYRNGYDLKPVFIKRYGADHDSTEASNNICSASLLREKILNNEDWRSFCPASTAAVLEKARREGKLSCSLQNAEKAVLYALRRLPSDSADNYAECGGGLGRRILNAASSARDLSDLYTSVATKRYTNARIRRAVISLLTGATEDVESSLPEFTCLLAADKKGLSLVKRSDFPVISTPSDLRRLEQTKKTDLYINAERLASLCFSKASPDYGFFKEKPMISDKNT